jgi:hypothetical protein
VGVKWLQSTPRFYRHTGEGQYPVKTINYWMLAFASMTVDVEYYLISGDF